MRLRCFIGVAAAVSAATPAHSQETKTEEIIITSTALRESTSQIAQPAAVLGGDELRRELASTLGETLTSQLGVTASYFGPSASRPIIRGLGGDRVLMLLDGISALDVSSLSQDHAVAIEPVLADQIEILKGPASLLYGSGAVGGIVNVIDGRIPNRVPDAKHSASLEVRGDTAMAERTAVGRFDLGGERIRLHLDGYRRTTDDVDIPGYAFSRAERAEHLTDEFVRNTLSNSASQAGGGAAGVAFGDDERFVGFAWSRLETGYGIPVSHEHEPEEGVDAVETLVRVDMQQDRYDLKAQRDLNAGPFSTLRVRGAYNRYGHRELEGQEIGTVVDQDAFDVRVHLDYGVNGYRRGTLGVQHTDIDFTAVGEEAFVPPSRSRNVGVFAFEEREFDAFTVELGGRVEHQRITTAANSSYDEFAYNVSAGGLWDPVEGYTLAVNLTRSQRHPQAPELFADGVHIASGRIEVGSATLKRETATTLDLSVHRHVAAGMHWQLTAYANEFADYIFPLDTGAEADGLPVFQYVQGDTQFYGFEGEVTLPLLISHTADIELRLASDYVRGWLKGGDNLPQLPPLRYGSELHLERDRLHVGVKAFHHNKQGRTARNERQTGGYTMLDADMSYRFSIQGRTQLLAFLRGTNLLDAEARRHSSPLKEVAPLPGRSVTAGFRASF